MKSRLTCLLSGAAMLAALSFTSCANMGPGEQSGTLIGAGTGALAGGIIGNNVRGGSTLGGAAIGAAAGGLIGNRVGNQQDQINEVKREQAYRRY